MLTTYLNYLDSLQQSPTCAHAVECYVQSDITKREETRRYLFTVKILFILLTGCAEGEPSA